jgi:hypothetical protein
MFTKGLDMCSGECKTICSDTEIADWLDTDGNYLDIMGKNFKKTCDLNSRGSQEEKKKEFCENKNICSSFPNCCSQSCKSLCGNTIADSSTCKPSEYQEDYIGLTCSNLPSDIFPKSSDKKITPAQVKKILYIVLISFGVLLVITFLIGLYRRIIKSKKVNKSN